MLSSTFATPRLAHCVLRWCCITYICHNHAPLKVALPDLFSGVIAGRLLVGLGIGGSAISVPAYLAEVAPAARRGAVVAAYELALAAGMLAAALVDWLLQGEFIFICLSLHVSLALRAILLVAMHWICTAHLMTGPLWLMKV